MRCVFVQIDTKLINADVLDDIAAKYYDTFWHNKESDGFYRPDSFWEIPQWIAELCYTLPDDWDKELYIVKDVSEAIDKLSDDNIDMIFFSCMDSNKRIIEYIIPNLPIQTHAITGGYAKLNLGDEPLAPLAYPNLRWYDSIAEFCKAYGIAYRYGLDYSLFENCCTIPRLTLSTGCKHTCKFCTVENEIVHKSNPEVAQQIKSFRPLNYRLIYINDKTFGQATNYIFLEGINKTVKFDNPDFDGFIVQTTCNQICKPGFVDELKSFGVKYVELGIESFNDNILQAMRKPQIEQIIHKALNLLHGTEIKVIANIIIGLPGETIESYRWTIDRLQCYGYRGYYKFYSLNINNLVLYADTKLADEIESDGTGDNEQLRKHKSYHTESDREAIDWFYNQIYKLGLEIVGE